MALFVIEKRELIWLVSSLSFLSIILKIFG